MQNGDSVSCNKRALVAISVISATQTVVRERKIASYQRRRYPSDRGDGDTHIANRVDLSSYRHPDNEHVFVRQTSEQRAEEAALRGKWDGNMSWMKSAMRLSQCRAATTGRRHRTRADSERAQSHFTARGARAGCPRAGYHPGVRAATTSSTWAVPRPPRRRQIRHGKSAPLWTTPAPGAPSGSRVQPAARAARGGRVWWWSAAQVCCSWKRGTFYLTHATTVRGSAPRVTRRATSVSGTRRCG
jgi:hypothetical protein